MKVNMTALSNMLGIDVRNHWIENNDPTDGKITIIKRLPGRHDWFELSQTGKQRICRSSLIADHTIVISLKVASTLLFRGMCKKIKNKNLKSKRMKIIMAALGEKVSTKFIVANRDEIRRVRAKLFSTSNSTKIRRFSRIKKSRTCTRFHILEVQGPKTRQRSRISYGRSRSCSLRKPSFKLTTTKRVVKTTP